MKDGPAPAVTPVARRSVPQWLALMMLACCYLLLWVFVRPYRGIEHDAQLYVLQGLRWLHPDLYAREIFFASGSQGEYTAFPPIVGWLAARLGIEQAAALLTLTGNLGLITAAGWLAVRIAPGPCSYLGPGLLAIFPVYYGAYSVFELSELFLTPRTLAEMACIAALGFAASRRWGPVVACLAFAFLLHPLMALPAALLAALMFVPMRAWKWLVAAGGAASLAILALPDGLRHGPLRIMDAGWLQVVRERSLYMFIERWQWLDWQWLIVHGAVLVLAARLLTVAAGRKLALASLLVAAAGLVLSATYSLASPVEILVQGQPWRWAWPAAALAILLTPMVVVTCWAAGPSGRAAAMLLGAAWIAEGGAGGLLAAAALTIFLARRHLDSVAGRTMQALAAGTVLIIVLWVIADSSLFLTATFTLGADALPAQKLRNLLSLGTPAVALLLALWFAAMARPSRGRLVTLGLALLLVGSWVVPNAWRDWGNEKFQSGRAEFADWRRQIAVGSQVLWLKEPLSTWLLLDRPNYLSVSQSAGVVFSRPTSEEIVRRAENLQPLVDRGWLMGGGHVAKWAPRTLTPAILESICRDPLLAYVVDETDLGNASRSVVRASTGRPVYLYDCARSRRRA